MTLKLISISKNVFKIKILNGNIYIYLMPCRVTIDTYLRRFQYKILNSVLYLNEEVFNFKIVSSLPFSFCNLENE